MASRILIDTDPGFDDSLALFLALSSNKNSVEAITSVYGNSSLEVTHNNVVGILNFAKSIGSIANPDSGKGSEKPLKKHFIPYFKIHGKSGLGNHILTQSQNTPTVSFNTIYKKFFLSNKNNGKILMLGPLTNLARFIKANSFIQDQNLEVVIMGGCFFTKGNYSDSVEANFGYDPEAARTVIESSIKNITLIPLDLTEKFVLFQGDLAKVRSPRLAKFLQIASSDYFSFYKKGLKSSFAPIHDALAYLYTLRPDLFKTTKTPVRIDSQGKSIIDSYSDKYVSIAYSARIKDLYNVFLKELNSYV